MMGTSIYLFRASIASLSEQKGVSAHDNKLRGALMCKIGFYTTIFPGVNACNR